MALMDHEYIASAGLAARDTALMFSPLVLLVVALLLPYLYRVLFLRAKVDRQSYEEGKSKTATIVRRQRRSLDFAAPHWADYMTSRRRNLKYRIEVSLLYDFAKAASAYQASDQWRDHLRRQGVAHVVFLDEDKSLRENLEQNGFFLSPFFKEGVVNRYLMQQVAGRHVPVRVQGDPALLARATVLFQEALDAIEPQFEEGRVYLPFITLSWKERLWFRIHTMFITRLLSQGLEKGLAMLLGVGLVALMNKRETASKDAQDYLMELVALLFMAHVFDGVLRNRGSQFKTDWEDRERYYYRRQMHQFILGLDSTQAREEARRGKATAQVLGVYAGDRRGVRRLVRTLKRTGRHPQEIARLLGAARDVMAYEQSEASPIALVLLKELAVSHPAAYAKLLYRWRLFRHPWAGLDPFVRHLLDDAPMEAVARRHNRRLPERRHLAEWQRVMHTLHQDFPADVDEAHVAHVTECLASKSLTPSQRRTLIVSFFQGGLLWRLRQMDVENPLGRQHDARLYHATLAFTLPALERLRAHQEAGHCDYGLQPAGFTAIQRQIQATLPLPPGHQLRLNWGDGQGVVPMLTEIQRAVARKRQLASFSQTNLSVPRLNEWLDACAGDQRPRGVLAEATHEAARVGLAAKLRRHFRAGTDSLLADPHAFDSRDHPVEAAWLRGQLARRGLDGQPNEPVLALLGFWGELGVPPAPLGQFPVRLTFLDLQPVVDYVLDRQRDAASLEEVTHRAMVKFYVMARLAGGINELPSGLTRPAEGEDAGGSIARQLAIIRSLRAGIQADQEPLFILLQQARHQLEVIFDPLHLRLGQLLSQATGLGPVLAEATRANLHRQQDAGLALLVPLTCMAEQAGSFAGGTEFYWSLNETTTDRGQFLQQFDVRDAAHAEAIIQARILLHHFEALRGLVPDQAVRERMTFGSFDTLAGDADQLRIGAATVMAMIDQSGLGTDARFRAVREVLVEARARQGYSNRGNLSDLVRVTLRRQADELVNATATCTEGTQLIFRPSTTLVPD